MAERHPIPWVFERHKKVGESWLCSLPDCWAGTSIFSCPHCSWCSALQTWTRAHVGSLVPRPLNHTTDFPGLPAHRPQIMRLLSLHSCVSQYFIINLFLYHKYHTHALVHTHDKKMREQSPLQGGTSPDSFRGCSDKGWKERKSRRWKQKESPQSQRTCAENPNKIS